MGQRSWRSPLCCPSGYWQHPEGYLPSANKVNVTGISQMPITCQSDDSPKPDLWVMVVGGDQIRNRIAVVRRQRLLALLIPEVERQVRFPDPRRELFTKIAS